MKKYNIDFPYSIESDEILKTLDTKISGLSSENAELRINEFGNNTLKNKNQNTKAKIFFRQFLSPLIFILLISAFITLFLKEYLNSFVIFFAVFINIILGFYQEYKAENAINRLNSYIKERAIVVRDGKEIEIDSSNICIGDIIKLTYGARVPADARIINHTNLKVDESILTGESAAVSKNNDVLEINKSLPERINMVFAGTLVVDGFAYCVVVKTGENTEIGKISNLVNTANHSQTPLQKSLKSFAWTALIVIILLVGIIFVLGISRGENVIEMIILSLAIAVATVPEALPIVTTVILSIGASKIVESGGVVRSLAASETLGSTTLIMSDKTGTLTLGDMELENIFVLDEIVQGKYETLDSSKSFFKQKINVLEYAIKNIDVVLENPDDDISSWNFSGRVLERNVAKVARIFAKDALRKNFSYTTNTVVPFSSKHKFSVVLDNNEFVLMGAPDILALRSNLNQDVYNKLIEKINYASQEGMRLVAIASKQYNSKDFDLDNENSLNFLGLLAFRDPLRPGIKETINKIESLGTKLVVITGDLPGTAIAITRELGWNLNESNILTGQDIHTLSDDELLKILPRIKVFARVTPEDKLRIGTLYQNLGEVVAMTGDGVNDAPALKAMNIGIALGSGSDVAKGVADIVLLNDSFDTITEAILSGRVILLNIQKAFVYLMATAFSIVFLTIISIFMSLGKPLNPVQIIWINLITGSLPALAFAYDKEKSLLKVDHSIFSRKVIYITSFVIFMSSLILSIFYVYLNKLKMPELEVKTILFISLSLFILLSAYSFKNLHRNIWHYNPFLNKKLNFAILLGIGLTLLSVILPIFKKVFELGDISIKSIILVVIFMGINLVVVEFSKFIFINRFKVTNS